MLIWNTPFMERCPHKGYCVPQAEYAMKLLGERTRAFEPLVSDDVSMYLPENLKRFDAIIFNNSNGPWIRPAESKINVVGSVGDPDELLKKVRPKQWNDYTLSARGGRIILKINGVIMCDLQDNDPRRIASGKLALQVHQGPDMLVQFKDIRIRQF